MNCIDEVRKAFFLSWVGDREYVERVRRECKDQFGETGLKERIAKAIEKVSWDWEIPLALRDDGIDSAQLVSGAISEFLES
ncbi:hypothetical protein [Metallosphaera hakonensis]|uniref:hypothetical protein n=1 Tax=Metallosphaera hakonensis TaxID=79601 RepID=UPI0006CF5AA8|nr:hypothetical protein [Metallosphaera hakonensis]